MPDLSRHRDILYLIFTFVPHYAYLQQLAKRFYTKIVPLNGQNLPLKSSSCPVCFFQFKKGSLLAIEIS